MTRRGCWHCPIRPVRLSTRRGIPTEHFDTILRLEQEPVVEAPTLADAAKVVLAVHDSIMMEVREDMLDEVAWTVKGIMTSWESAGVPLVVDQKAGKSWGSLSAYPAKAA